MERFELWTADLLFPKESGLKKGRRPVVVVSDGETIGDTGFVSVVPLTRELTKEQRLSHVLLCSRYLDYPSRALCEQITTVDKARLIRRIGYVEDPFDRFAINRALAVHLHLAPAGIIYVQEDMNNGYY
ncbi:type II toxin-antitoxin system PemK/MazF family toxin [Oscillibacter valericigenes]|uniref:type II toxin-antitoxin system PemK/MazF family toxin n=1 Tax=Oscillibacter valericigenes TaxID=351091 RepID=UPI001F35F74B|nr:type II toxin-antitoxin system PemK/MazF family toxin [Oscillibacter valericigenes]MCF2615679.1 type II toxin-antitoxin system PemK/MazF family toxin [Oscillibacter valericigenes]